MKSYTLKQAQHLVRDAIERSEKRHKRWRALETLYTTGSLDQANAVMAASNSPSLTDLYPALGDDHVNLVKPNIDIILASTLRHDPHILAVPVAGGPDAEESKHLAEHVTSHFWRMQDATAILKDATWDQVTKGNGFVKVGWLHQEEEREPTPDEQADLLEDMLVVEEQQAKIEGREPLDPDDLVSNLPGTVVEAVANEPYVAYVSPFDLFVPPNARRLSETRWVAQRVTMPIDELKDNDVLSGEIVADTEMASGQMSADSHVSEWRRQAQREHLGLESDPDLFDTATVFEFYDMAARRMMVFQIDGKEALYEGPIPYSHRHTPFVHLRNHNVSGVEFWAMGDVENIANIQHNFNEFLREQLDNARRSGNKYFVDKRVLTDDVAAGIESNEPDVVIPVDTQQMDLREVVVAVERKALSGDVYAAKADLEDYMLRVLGVNDFQAGGVGADRMSATAAAVVDGVASLRGEEKVWQVEQAAAQIGLLMLLLCQEFLDTEVAVRIAGEDGANWVNLTNVDLLGEYAMQVEGGSMQAVNPATREQKAMRLITEIAPILTELGYDPEPAIRAAMRDMGYDPDVLMVQSMTPEQPAPGAGGMPPGMEEMGLPAPPGVSGLPMPGEEGAPPAAVPGGPMAPVAAQAEAGIAL